METFSALLALCAGKSPITGEFPSQRSVTRSFVVFFDLRQNKRVNYREAGEFRRHRAHYDVIVVSVRVNMRKAHKRPARLIPSIIIEPLQNHL